MIANYHTHTWRCRHADGTEREYVERAIEGGLKILGFSDHTPMPYEDGYESFVKMSMDQLEDYVDTVLALKNEYRREIDILLGLEVEYYPRYWEKLLKVTGKYPFDFFLLGQHFLGNEIGEAFCGRKTPDPENLRRYVTQTKEALETGLFTYFAHPDVLNFTGDPGFYQECMRGLCVHAKELEIPLEINLLGIETDRHYPNPLFWQIVSEVGNRVILGSDAHRPEDVVNEEGIREALGIVERYHLELIDTVELKRPVPQNTFCE